MNTPYGSKQLVSNLAASRAEAEELTQRARQLKSFIVPDRFLSDCEMLATGAFTPLEGFMNRSEVDSVVRRAELPSGLIWGIPIVLLTEPEAADPVKANEEIALLDADKNVIALMRVTEKFRYPKDVFCKEVFKTADAAHPGVKIMMESPDVFLAGPVKMVNRPKRREVSEAYYLDPARTREEFRNRKWETIVAFQTRNPIHRAHEFLIKCALETVDGVLIHPLVGETKADDIPANVRMKCYETLIRDYFNHERILLSVLPTFMRYAGPREALNHAIIRKNYGCTHFIIGRDHAGVGSYYGTYEAQHLLSHNAGKIGIVPVKFDNSFFCRKCKGMATLKTCPHPQENHLHLSGTKVREMLRNGEYPPEEFSRKEVIDILIEWGKSA